MDAKTQRSELTRIAIINAALDIASETGLLSVTLQGVASRLHLSKSGIFSRVGSMESLQLAVAQEYGRRFIEQVFLPSLQKPKGIERLRSLVQAWVMWVSSAKSMGNCLFETAAFTLELSHQSELRHNMAQAVAAWRQMMRKTIAQCTALGHLEPSLDIDAFMFELYSMMLGGLYDAQFMGDTKAWHLAQKCFDNLIARYQPPVLQPTGQ